MFSPEDIRRLKGVGGLFIIGKGGEAIAARMPCGAPRSAVHGVAIAAEGAGALELSAVAARLALGIETGGASYAVGTVVTTILAGTAWGDTIHQVEQSMENDTCDTGQ
jgi:hypothetical protein